MLCRSPPKYWAKALFGDGPGAPPGCCFMPLGPKFQSDRAGGSSPRSWYPEFWAKAAFSGCPGGPRQCAAPCLRALNFRLHGVRARVLGSPKYRAKAAFWGPSPACCSMPSGAKFRS